MDGEVWSDADVPTSRSVNAAKRIWVSYGMHTSPKWISKQLSWPKMAKRLMADNPTAETMDEWLAMSHATQTEIKGSLGGWIGGNTRGGRSTEDVQSRSLLALDVDDPTPDLQQRVEALGFEAVMHPTHTPGRWRVVFPLDYPVDAQEYRDLAKRLMYVIPGCDPHSAKPAGLMFWPTRCADSAARPVRFRTGEYLSPDSVFAIATKALDVPGADTVFSSWAGLTVKELCDRVRNAEPGTRNEMLNSAVYVAAASGMLSDTAEQEFRQAAFDAGLGRAETDKTLESARKAGGEELADRLDQAFGEELEPLDDADFDTTYRIQWGSESSIQEPKELWHDLLPLGALSIISGMGGIGKSTLDAWLAAKASNGEMDGDVPGKLKVLMVMDEDDWEVDTMPRLIAAGANLANVGKLFIKRPQLEEVGVPTFPNDISILRRVIEENDIKLVILDVITSMMAAGMDTNKQADVRALLNPLLRVAQSTECAIIAVNHWRKQGGSISHMISGSTAYRDTARCIWGIVMDPDTGSRLVKIDKYNRSPKQGATFAFELESKKIPGWTKTVGAVVNWRESTTDAQKIIDQEASPELLVGFEVVEWLSSYLTSNGPSKWAEIRAAGKEDGFAETQLKQAREKLRCVQRSMPSNGQIGRPPVLWSLPYVAEPNPGELSDDEVDEFMAEML